MNDEQTEYRLLAVGMMMSVAHASDNGVEIDMSGTVIASTCDVETADTLQTVYIGNFASTLFSSVGDVSPSADLLIRLNNCSSGISGATVKFSGTADNDNSKLLALSDTAGAGEWPPAWAWRSLMRIKIAWRSTPIAPASLCKKAITIR